MKTVVLIGMYHKYQLGETGSEYYKQLLKETCDRYCIEGIAEEIKHDGPYLAESFCLEKGLEHLIIEPKPSEHEALGIPLMDDLENLIMMDYSCDYPEISPWPSVPSFDNLPEKVFEAYEIGKQPIHRAREKEWLKRILSFDVDTILCICGSAHFNYFSALMQESGIDVREEYEDWKSS